MHVMYRGWAGGRGRGGQWRLVGGGGGWASLRLVLPAIRAPTVALCPQQVTDMCTTHRMDWDRDCQQFDTTPTLISAHQRPYRPCNAPIRLYRVSKKPSVKGDLAMYSHIVDVSKQCMSVSLTLGCNWISVPVPLGLVFANPVTYKHLKHATLWWGHSLYLRYRKINIMYIGKTERINIAK